MGRPKKNEELFLTRKEEIRDLYITQKHTLEEVKEHFRQQGFDAR